MFNSRNNFGSSRHFTVFGPQDYVRDTGAPVTLTNTFSIQNLNTPYTLKVFNGGLHDDTTELVSSSVVISPYVPKGPVQETG